MVSTSAMDGYFGPQRVLSLGQLGVDIRIVDDDVLDKDLWLDLLALEILRKNVEAEPAPFHRIELDRHGEIAVLDGAQRRRDPVHAGDQSLTLAVGGKHGLSGAQRNVI